MVWGFSRIALIVWGGRNYDGTNHWLDSGARYNLARAYEADGQTEKAIDLLEKTPPGDPQRDGNLVRAHRLKSAAGKTDHAPSTP